MERIIKGIHRSSMHSIIMLDMCGEKKLQGHYKVETPMNAGSLCKCIYLYLMFYFVS